VRSYAHKHGSASRSFLSRPEMTYVDTRTRTKRNVDCEWDNEWIKVSVTSLLRSSRSSQGSHLTIVVDLSMSSFTSALLLFLTLQRSTSSILLHEAGQGYSTSLAILLGELLKQGFCLVTGLYQVQQDLNVRLPVTSRSSRREQLATACYEAKEAFKVFLSRAISREAWKVALPAALYVVQNNLYLYASSRLQPSTFQVSLSLFCAASSSLY
jgi:hypothetical protein